MNSFTRARLYLKRHPVKTAILTTFLLFISIALSLLISLNTSLTQDRKRLSDSQLHQSLVTRLRDVPAAQVNPASRTYFEEVVSENHLNAHHLISEEVTIGETESEQTRVYSLVNQDFFEKSQLVDKELVLEAGTFLNENSGSEALISRNLANRYHLAVGDTISITSTTGQKLALRIEGIFKTKHSPFANRESDTLEHTILTTRKTLEQLNPQYSYHTSIYHAKNEANMTQARACLQAGTELKDYQLTQNTSIQLFLKTLNSQQGLLKWILWGTIVLSHLVLLFFLHLWMKGRQLEIGVLQSLGKSRMEILLQYMLEVLILASITLTIGLVVTNLFLPSLREVLLSDMLKTSYENADNGEWLPAVFLANHHYVKDLLSHPVRLAPLDILLIVGSVLGLSVGAVLLSCLSLLRYSPKKIFAMML
ncbi:ABC transporter permease [Streptococcus marmotae]|uniref:ABC transporter permease n=1 Tax=Streptococcus marmotae TaxID=1825069 RepID=UPI00082BBCAE|nr:ABC transporter permease [Streptococcus marmotae]